MPKVLVIFGSKSDSEVYGKIHKILKSYNISHDLEVASAHRNPERVDSIIGRGYDIIIAGAGMSAALPGVIASKTIKPVIGVPCEGSYQGLDALLSISQMPKGVPVLSVGVSQADVAGLSAIKMLRHYDSVSLIGPRHEKAVDGAADTLARFNIPFKFAKEPSEASVNIEFVYFDEQLERKEQLVIYCPLLMKDDNKAEAALNFLKHSDHGLWVGLNNGVNAAVAAAQIMALNHPFESQIIKYREELK